MRCMVPAVSMPPPPCPDVQVVGLPCCDEVVLRGMLALEAAMVAHGSPLPAATGSATAVAVGDGGSTASAADVSVAVASAHHLYRQAYCPEITLERTLADLEAAKPGSKNRKKPGVVGDQR